MTDLASGQAIELSRAEVRFKAPQIRSEKSAGGQTVMEMAFNSRKEAEEWTAKQKAEGAEIEFIGEARKARYHLGTSHKQITLGGNEEGLRAIAYIAQTFFAHSFPEIARMPELQEIKNYTLHNTGTDFGWWDFDPPADLPPNSFPFGHRVIVGLNGENGTAYAHVSFFSALNFAVLLGKIPCEASRASITDIDPLAKSPPNDIVISEVGAALGAVPKPDNLSAGLAEAIRSGKAEAKIHDLMRRITDFERDTTASKLMRQIAGASNLPDGERQSLFSKIVSSETQRVLNLMTFLAKDLKARAANPIERALADFIERAVRLDPTAENGLSIEAAASLAVASDALARQMRAEFESGKLDDDRMSMLIGGGPGAHVVGMALMEMFIQSFRPE